MALTTQTVPVVFSGGLDQKTAEQLTIPGKFLVLDNCVRRKLGKVQKRYGFTEFSKTVIGRDDLSSASALFKFNDELLQVNNNRLNTYLSSQDQWADRGAIGILNTSVEQLIRNSSSQTMPDVVEYDGRVVCAWEDDRGGIRCSVFDNVTGSSIFYDQEVSSTGVRPKVIAINGKILIVYIRAGALYMKSIDSQNPTSLSSEVQIDSQAVDSAFDVEAWSDTYAIIAWRQTSTTTAVGYLTSEGEIGSASTALPAPAIITIDDGESLTIARAPDEDLIYVFLTDGTAVENQLHVFSANLLVTTSVTVFQFGPFEAANLALAVKPDGVIWGFLEERNISNPHYTKLSYQLFYYDGSSLTLESSNNTFNWQAGLASKPIVVDSAVYLVTCYDSALQSTYFTYKIDGDTEAEFNDLLVGRSVYGLGGGLSTKSGLPRITGDYFTGLVIKNKLVGRDGIVQADNTGIMRLNMVFGASVYNTAQLGDNLHIAGSNLLNYDGSSLAEHGFHLYPENLTFSVTNSGGNLAAGTYYYHVTYEWQDNKGQIHRSAPSVQSDGQTVTGGSSRVNISVPSLWFTSKDRNNVMMVLYRSLDGQIFYRVASQKISQNGSGSSIQDGVGIYNIDNTELLEQEVLYTTGGVVENIAPPACTVTTLHRNRLFLGGLEEKGFIAYSKEYVAGEGVAFSDIFKIPVDPASGNVTALASMDEKLVIFKKDRTYTLVGDGPLDTGAQDDFSKPQLISGDIGCDNPSSIVSVPDGLMFKSDKGIYLLTRNLTFEYVGADVEDFNDLTITSAVLLEDENEVRFTSSDGETLVYNFYFKQWSTFSNYEALGAVVAVDGYLHLKSDGTVRKESPGAYLDAGSRIAMTIETSWLAFAGIQNYQRVKEWMLLGDFISDHYTKVELFYDYESFSSETVYFNVDEGLDLSYYGDDAVYGDSEVYGGTGSGVFQFTSVPRKQKCQSVKLRISDIDTKTVAGGGSFNLVGLTFEVGQKQGLTKQLLGNKTVGS